jgi:hypothetical protein
MSGVNILELDAADAVDVLHYLFEVDIYETQAEAVEAKSDARSMIYKDLYESRYKYATSKKKSTYSATASDGSFDDIVPFDPLNQETKAYVPPTDFDADSYLPFGGTLDAPVN